MDAATPRFIHKPKAAASIWSQTEFGKFPSKPTKPTIDSHAGNSSLMNLDAVLESKKLKH